MTRTPVISVRPEKMVWDKARELAGGDVARLQTNRDGSVTVWNHPRK